MRMVASRERAAVRMVIRELERGARRYITANVRYGIQEGAKAGTKGITAVPPSARRMDSGSGGVSPRSR